MQGARLEMGSTVSPHQRERSSCLFHPTEPTTHPSGAVEGPSPSAVPKQAGKLAVCFLCATPWLCGVSTLHLSMGHSAVAWVLLDVYACFEEAPNLQRPPITLAHTGINNLNTTISKNFSHRNHSLRPVCGLQCSSLKISNIKTLRFTLGC